MEHFITEIRIEKLRHLSDITIELNSTKRTNLLLTGKNGSGKTTLLRAIKQYLQAVEDNELTRITVIFPKEIKTYQELIKYSTDENMKQSYMEDCQGYIQGIERYAREITIAFSDTNGMERQYQQGEYLIAFYGVDRKTGISKVTGVENVVLDSHYPSDSNLSDVLLKYLVHLKT